MKRNRNSQRIDNYVSDVIGVVLAIALIAIMAALTGCATTDPLGTVGDDTGQADLDEHAWAICRELSGSAGGSGEIGQIQGAGSGARCLESKDQLQGCMRYERPGFSYMSPGCKE